MGWEVAVPERLAFVCVLMLFLSTGAFAQNANDFIRMFGGIVQQALIQAARLEWHRLPPNELSCIDQGLRHQGATVDALASRGVLPSDQRLFELRLSCRTSAAPLSSASTSDVDIENLSSKPTFDCARARSLTARVVCLDQAGAAADWDLISAYWARYFSLVETDRQTFDQAQQTWLDSLNQTCSRVQNPQQCVLSAYHKHAAVYRSQLEGDALAESRLTPQQRAEIQQSLVALGLLDDKPDGEFGAITRAAIKRFKTQSGIPPSEFLTSQERQKLLQVTPSPAALPGAQSPSAIPSSSPPNDDAQEAKWRAELDRANYAAEEAERKRITAEENARRAADEAHQLLESERQKQTVILAVLIGVLIILCAVAALISVRKRRRLAAGGSIPSFGIPEAKTSLSKNGDEGVLSEGGIKQVDPRTGLSGASQDGDFVDQLAKFAKLHSDGALTDEEFKGLKASLIGPIRSIEMTPNEYIKYLRELRDDGAITEDEFQSKVLASLTTPTTAQE